MGTIVAHGNLAVSTTAEKFKTTQTSSYIINEIYHTYPATDALTFTAAHVISASKYGCILIQIDGTRTVSTKVVSSTQAYNDAPTALAALPAADANKVALGYLAIANNAGDWTANTDDLTDGSDLTTAAFTDATETTISVSTYCSVDDLKDRLWPPGTTTDTTNDVALSSIIGAVSKWIDEFTGTRFYTTAADETRYYSPEDAEMLFTDDIISITTLKTDEDGDHTYETTWTVSTDYDLMPYSAALDARPYRMIDTTPFGSYSFPVGIRKGVQIVGKFGYCTIANLPRMVNEACLLQCERIWKRKDAPFGVVSNPLGGEMRVIKDLDPDVQMMLVSFKRFV